jgi:hypothetical protein
MRIFLKLLQKAAKRLFFNLNFRRLFSRVSGLTLLCACDDGKAAG